LRSVRIFNPELMQGVKEAERKAGDRFLLTFMRQARKKP